MKHVLVTTQSFNEQKLLRFSLFIIIIVNFKTVENLFLNPTFKTLKQNKKREKKVMKIKKIFIY